MKFLIAALACASVLLAGCGASSSLDSPVSGRTARAPAWANDRLSIDVAVQVVTIGLPDATVAALRARLAPKLVDQAVETYPAFVVEGSVPVGGAGGYTSPILPTARYTVVPAGAHLAAGFAAQLSRVQVQPGVYDALAMEDWLASALPAAGIALDPSAPTLVLMHLAAFGAPAHRWSVATKFGERRKLRVFGERAPLLALDPSADADPAAGSGGYLSPVAADADGPLAQFVTDATEFRLLQANLYPPPQQACHAVTALVGLRSTSLAEATGMMATFEQRFDPAPIKAAFDRLTGSDVFLDVKVLRLPVDDPALDAVGQGGYNTLDAQRYYLAVNWDKYHVAHPGCAEYLTAVFIGDVTYSSDIVLGSPSGYASYGETMIVDGKRLAMGWFSDGGRLLSDPGSPAACAEAALYGCASTKFHVWDEILTHETGHLFGQRHPHDIDRPDGSFLSNWAFDSTWTTMNYEMFELIGDFGAVDQNNFQRNRAGWALRAAAAEGLEGTPAWRKAMAALGRYDWRGAWEALQP